MRRQDSQAALLNSALHAEDESERLRAARLLRDQPMQETIPALVTALRDDNPGVRWLAGEALIRVGRGAVVPLLDRLVSEPPDAWMMDEAAHVLRHLQLSEFEGVLAPVIAACEHSTRSIEVPVQAELARVALLRLSPASLER